MAQPSVIELPARIDSLTSSDIDARINTALDGAPSALVLDFSSVTFVSSAGLRVLLMAAKRCRGQNTQIALHSVSPQVETMFSVSGLTSFFPMFPDRAAALAGI